MDLLYSVQTNITCIILLIIIKYQMVKRTSSYSAADMLLNMCTTLIIVICASDMIAVILNGRTFLYAHTVLEIINIIYFESITFIGYVWMLYVLVRLGKVNDLRDRKLLLWAVPLILFTLIMLTNHWHQLVFVIDAANKYRRGSMVFIHWILTWPYMLVITAILFYRVYIAKNKVQMTDSKIMLSFIVAPFISSILQMVLGGTSVTQVGMTISVMIIYVASLNRQIRRDPLTGLNNNRAFRSYIGDIILREQTSTKLTIIMMDIDDFKNINDTYGHLEGDRALVLASDVLKKVCGSSDKSPFLCRFAGDEFVVAGVDLTQADIGSIIRNLNKELSTMTNDYNLPYSISMSIGHSTRVCCNNIEVDDLISMADMNMYIDKRAKKERG